MPLIFFIKSTTVEISKYTIKDLLGSSGRLDVISRCILAALLGGDDCFEKNVQIWVFLDNYGTYIFDSEKLIYESFPKTELLLTDYFVNLIKEENLKSNSEGQSYGLVTTSNMSFIEALNHFMDLNYIVFILEENGENLFKNIDKIRQKMNDIIFIIGNQSGEIINSKELRAMHLPRISLGTQSYLASSVIRLIKLHLISFQ